MTLKTFRGRCHHCGHDHDAGPTLADLRGTPTAPKEVGEPVARSACPRCGWLRGHDYGCPNDPLNSGILQLVHHHIVDASDCHSDTKVVMLSELQRILGSPAAPRTGEEPEFTIATLSKAIGCKALSLFNALPHVTLNQRLNVDDVATIMAHLHAAANPPAPAKGEEPTPDPEAKPETGAAVEVSRLAEELRAVCAAADSGASGWVKTSRIREVLANNQDTTQ